MNMTQEELHSNINDVDAVYKNYSNLLMDHVKLERKYCKCLSSLKELSEQCEVLRDGGVSTDQYELVVMERDNLQLQLSRTTDKNSAYVNDLLLRYQNSCEALDQLNAKYRELLTKCDELKDENKVMSELCSVPNPNEVLEGNGIRFECHSKCEENEQLQQKVDEYLGFKTVHAETQTEYEETARNRDSESSKLQKAIQTDGSEYTTLKGEHDDLLKKYLSLEDRFGNFTKEYSNLQLEVDRLHKIQRDGENTTQNHLWNLFIELRGVVEKYNTRSSEMKRDNNCDIVSISLPECSNNVENKELRFEQVNYESEESESIIESLETIMESTKGFDLISPISSPIHSPEMNDLVHHGILDCSNSKIDYGSQQFMNSDVSDTTRSSTFNAQNVSNVTIENRNNNILTSISVPTSNLHSSCVQSASTCQKIIATRTLHTEADDPCDNLSLQPAGEVELPEKALSSLQFKDHEMTVNLKDLTDSVQDIMPDLLSTVDWRAIETTDNLNSEIHKSKLSEPLGSIIANDLTIVNKDVQSRGVPNISENGCDNGVVLVKNDEPLPSLKSKDGMICSDCNKFTDFQQSLLFLCNDHQDVTEVNVNNSVGIGNGKPTLLPKSIMANGVHETEMCHDRTNSNSEVHIFCKNEEQVKNSEEPYSSHESLALTNCFQMNEFDSEQDVDPFSLNEITNKITCTKIDEPKLLEAVGKGAPDFCVENFSLDRQTTDSVSCGNYSEQNVSKVSDGPNLIDSAIEYDFKHFEMNMLPIFMASDQGDNENIVGKFSSDINRLITKENVKIHNISCNTDVENELKTGTVSDTLSEVSQDTNCESIDSAFFSNSSTLEEDWINTLLENVEINSGEIFVPKLQNLWKRQTSKWVRKKKNSDNEFTLGFEGNNAVTISCKPKRKPGVSRKSELLKKSINVKKNTYTSVAKLNNLRGQQKGTEEQIVVEQIPCNACDAYNLLRINRKRKLEHSFSSNLSTVMYEEPQIYSNKRRIAYIPRNERITNPSADGDNPSLADGKVNIISVHIIHPTKMDGDEDKKGFKLVSPIVFDSPASPEQITPEMDNHVPVVIPTVSSIENRDKETKNKLDTRFVLANLSDLAIPKSLKPVVALSQMEKMTVEKGRGLIDEMLRFCTCNEKIFQMAKLFIHQPPKFIAKLILESVVFDVHDEPTKGNHPREPHLTIVQRGLYKFIMSLEKLNVKGVSNAYLRHAELYLRTVENPATLSPVTRLYAAICKGKFDYIQMRCAICAALADMGDLAIPYVYIVLRVWIEVFPRKGMLAHSHILIRAIVQIILLKSVPLPEYNLINLRSLLFNYYEFSREGEDIRVIFKELLNYYIDEQNECARVLSIALMKHVNEKILIDEILPDLKIRGSTVSDTSQSCAIITLVMHFTKHAALTPQIIASNLQWLKQFCSDSQAFIIKSYANSVLQWYMNANSNLFNILEALGSGG